MKKTIIEMDLDNTIFRKTQNFSEKTINSLKRLHRKGYFLILNSGRPISQLKMILNDYDMLDLFEYLIGSNGAECYDVKNNQYQLFNYLCPDIIKKIYNKYQNEDMSLCLYDDDFLTNKYLDKYLARVKQLKMKPSLYDFNLITKPYPKMLAIIEPEDREYFKMIIDKDNDDDYDSYFSGEYIIEFVPKNSSKATGVNKLIDALSLNDYELYSFGDNENDYEMLKYSKGVMMGYDNEFLKDVAKYATDTCDENGFSNFVDEYFK